MTNLNQFLEEEQKELKKELNAFQFGTVLAVETGVYIDRYEQAVEYIHEKTKDHDTRLVNFVLELVKEEVEKLEYCSKCCSPKEYCKEWGKWESAVDTKDISTLVDSLKIK